MGPSEICLWLTALPAPPAADGWDAPPPDDLNEVVTTTVQVVETMEARVETVRDEAARLQPTSRSIRCKPLLLTRGLGSIRGARLPRRPPSRHARHVWLRDL